MLNEDAGSDPLCLLLIKDVLMAMDFNGGLLNLKQDMDATRDNVKTMCHCSCIIETFFPLMHSELTCTGTINADVRQRIVTCHNYMRKLPKQPLC